METYLELETLVELPQRLETSFSTFILSPNTVALTQTALALNAVNVGGNQAAVAANLAAVHIG